MVTNNAGVNIGTRGESAQKEGASQLAYRIRAATLDVRS